ncbi:MAG: hemolysin family protein [Clostridia bacterium]|nr:hemolysin family protein [Clostridia bacterium]
MHIAIILICLVFSALFSASETAYSSLSKARLTILAKENRKGAGRALKLYDRYNTILTTILIGNNLVNIIMAAAATTMFIEMIGGSGPAVSTAVITVLVLVFGEILPKSLAKDYPERFACFISLPLDAASKLFFPLAFLFEKLKSVIARILGPKEDTSFTTDELLVMFEEGEKEGALDADESELLSNTVEFLDCLVSEVLVPRNQITAVEVRTPKKKIADIFEETDYSRLPVYQKDPDHIIGILHRSDFITADGLSKEPLKKLCSKPVFLSLNTEAGDALKVLQENNAQMGIVLDTDKHFAGIVTMEDLLEEIVGEIEDEHDADDANAPRNE